MFEQYLVFQTALGNFLPLPKTELSSLSQN